MGGHVVVGTVNHRGGRLGGCGGGQLIKMGGYVVARGGQLSRWGAT